MKQIYFFLVTLIIVFSSLAHSSNMHDVYADRGLYGVMMAHPNKGNRLHFFGATPLGYADKKRAPEINIVQALSLNALSPVQFQFMETCMKKIQEENKSGGMRHMIYMVDKNHRSTSPEGIIGKGSGAVEGPRYIVNCVEPQFIKSWLGR
jgi:hypothetical protein